MAEVDFEALVTRLPQQVETKRVDAAVYAKLLKLKCDAKTLVKACRPATDAIA